MAQQIVAPKKYQEVYHMVRAYLLNRNELEKISCSDDIFSEGRREKIEKLKREEDKQLSAAAELLLIYALKEMDPGIVLPLKITEEESGNLLLDTKTAGQDKLFFNLSHSKDYAVCAVCDQPVGVDIECVKTRDVAHMDRILHEKEYQILGFITNSEEKKKYFYECWVTKESYLKNLGCGLSVRPSDFMADEDKLETKEKGLEKRYVHIYKASEIENADWHFDASYRMAICTRRKDPDVKVSILKAEDFSGGKDSAGEE